MAKRETVASAKSTRKVKKRKVNLVPNRVYGGSCNGISFELYLGDTLKYLRTLENDSVHLCFTSPPYNCRVPYDNYEDDMDWEDYRRWMEEVFAEVFRTIVPGGKAAVVIPVFVRSGGRRILLLPLFTEVMERAGFEFYDHITWVKAKSEEELGGVAGRSTAWGSYMLPSSPVSRPVSEIILVFKKRGKFAYDKGAVDITKEEFKLSTINVWMVRQKSSFDHPASFPEELVERAVKLYTARGQVVLDPFAGVGSTAVASVKNGRHFKGAEISPLYVHTALERLKRLCGDGFEGEF